MYWLIFILLTWPIEDNIPWGNFICLCLPILSIIHLSTFIPIPKKGNAKECSNYPTIALISHSSKVMLKILQAKLQQYMNHELPYVQAGFRKGRGCRDEIDNIHCIIRKARKFQKNIYFCFIDYTKVLTMLITANSGKFFKRWDYQTPDLPPEKPVCRSRSNS